MTKTKRNSIVIGVIILIFILLISIFLFNFSRSKSYPDCKIISSVYPETWQKNKNYNISVNVFNEGNYVCQLWGVWIPNGILSDQLDLKQEFVEPLQTKTYTIEASCDSQGGTAFDIILDVQGGNRSVSNEFIDCQS